MGLYPICLKVAGWRCLVVGGGNVAERKVKTLLTYGAEVVVVSPEATEEIAGLSRQGRIELLGRAFQESDLDGAMLAIAATDDSAVNEAVFSNARSRKILVNVVDVPELCDFYVPAVVERGDLQISVSTGGACPAFAKRIRRELEEEFGEEYGEFLRLLGVLRDELKRKVSCPEKRRIALEEFMNSNALSLIAEGRGDEVEGIYRGCLSQYVD